MVYFSWQDYTSWSKNKNVCKVVYRRVYNVPLTKFYTIEELWCFSSDVKPYLRCSALLKQGVPQAPLLVMSGGGLAHCGCGGWLPCHPPVWV